MSAAKPNIVYLHAHDLGRYCEPMGYDIPAPRIMQFAREGVLFRQCHSAAPSCAPSRAALVTGQYPHRCGMLGLPSPGLGYRLKDYDQHLGAFLRRQGYETALSGVQHVAKAPWAPKEEFLPYDHFLNHTPTEQQEFDPALTTSAAVEFINRPHGKPFFLSVGYLDPHRDNRGDPRIFIESVPAQEPEDIEERALYCQPWPQMPDNGVTRKEMANFKMGVEMLDRDVAGVLDALDTPEHRENTLVIFTTDHGPGVCEMKCTLTDRGTGVLMILRGPSGAPYNLGEAGTGGKVVDVMTQHLDLYPTIAELIGAEAPADLDGKSLLPLLRGEETVLHEEIFTEQTYHWSADPRPLRAVRTDRYKYIRSWKSDQPRGVDPGPAEQFWREFGYGKQPYPDEQLFDLIFDPHESNNLAGSEAHAGILEEMRNRLDQWMESTEDPLRTGAIPQPPAQKRKPDQPK